jgi:hypothetical protein
MKSMYCKRHGHAVSIIGNAIRKKRDCPVFLDAETVEHTVRSGLPSWFPACRNASKPDIIMMPYVPHIETELSHLRTPQDVPVENRFVWLVEFGYSSDRSVGNKFKSKLDQHARYKAQLEAYGWNVRIVPIVMTYSALASDTLPWLLNEIGQTPREMNATRDLLTKLTLEYNRKLIYTRKKLRVLLENAQVDPG